MKNSIKNKKKLTKNNNFICLIFKLFSTFVFIMFAVKNMVLRFCKGVLFARFNKK